MPRAPEAGSLSSLSSEAVHVGARETKKIVAHSGCRMAAYSPSYIQKKNFADRTANALTSNWEITDGEVGVTYLRRP